MFSAFFWFCSALLVLCSLTPRLGTPAKWADLPSHFLVQYMLGCVVLALLVRYFEADRAIYLLLALTFISCALQVALCSPAPQWVTADTAGKTLKLLQSNALRTNKETAALRRLIEREKPDIIAIAEANSPFTALLKDIVHDYPYEFSHPKDKSSFGVAVAARLPLHDLALRRFAGEEVDTPSLTFDVELNGETITFVTMHAENPVRTVINRNKDFEGLQRWVEEKKPAHLVITGDMNATPWCHSFRSLTRNLHLTNLWHGAHILLGSWPALWRLPVPRLPIDHVLISRNIIPVSFVTGPYVGSDHLPTLTVLGVQSTRSSKS